MLQARRAGGANSSGLGNSGDRSKGVNKTMGSVYSRYGGKYYQ